MRTGDTRHVTTSVWRHHPPRIHGHRGSRIGRNLDRCSGNRGPERRPCCSGSNSVGAIERQRGRFSRSAPQPGDWTKPAAWQSRKRDTSSSSKGDTVRCSQDAGQLRLHDHRQRSSRGREEAIRAYGKTIEEAVAGAPDVLAPLKLHYLRWVLFDIGNDTYFMYQGFSTPISTNTPKTLSALSRRLGSTRCLRTSRDSRRLENECSGIRQICPRTSASELPGVRRIPVCHSRRNQKGAEGEKRLSTMLDQMQ